MNLILDIMLIVTRLRALILSSSAPPQRGLQWRGSDMNSLAMMSCQLLCFPFALELPQEKMAAILHSYQSLNIVEGLVQASKSAILQQGFVRYIQVE